MGADLLQLNCINSQDSAYGNDRDPYLDALVAPCPHTVMGIFDRLLGKSKVQNEHPRSLQMLFAAGLPVDAATTTARTKFSAGHTMQVGEDAFLRARAPTRSEYFLDSAGPLLVIERITQAQINR